MSSDRLTTVFGLIAGISELLARTGVLGDRTIIADGVASAAIALIGLFSRGRAATDAEEAWGGSHGRSQQRWPSFVSGSCFSWWRIASRRSR